MNDEFFQDHPVANTDLSAVEARVLDGIKRMCEEWTVLEDRLETELARQYVLSSLPVVLFRQRKLQEVGWRVTAARNRQRNHELRMDGYARGLVVRMFDAWSRNWHNTYRAELAVTEVMSEIA